MVKPISSKKPKKTIDINIFRGGTQTSNDGDTINFDVNSLEDVVRTYNPQNHEAALIVSHDENNEGAPSLGWCEKLFRKGNELWANVALTSIGERLLEDGIYKKVSSSFYLPGSQSNPYGDKLALRHLALVTIPAVKGLKQFSEKSTNVISFSENNQIVTYTNMIRPDEESFAEELEDADMDKKQAHELSPQIKQMLGEDNFMDGEDFHISDDGELTLLLDGNEIEVNSEETAKKLGISSEAFGAAQDYIQSVMGGADPAESFSEHMGKISNCYAEDMDENEGEESPEVVNDDEENLEKDHPVEQDKISHILENYSKNELEAALALMTDAPGETAETMQNADKSSEEESNEDSEKEYEEVDISKKKPSFIKKGSADGNDDSPETSAAFSELRSEVLGLKAQLFKEKRERKIEKFASFAESLAEQGAISSDAKILETLVKFMLEIEESSKANVNFSEYTNETSLVDYFMDFVSKLAPSVSFGEVAPESSSYKKPGYEPDPKNLYPENSEYIYDQGRALLHDRAIKFSEQNNCDYFTAVKTIIADKNNY